jgi:hypothetical protein
VERIVVNEMPLVECMRRIAALAAVSLVILGCRPTSTSHQSHSAAPLQLLTDDSGDLIDETWDAHYVRGAKVGHRHTRVFRLSHGGQEFLKIVAEDLLEMKRFGDVAEQRLTTINLETPEGLVTQLAYEVQNGDEVQRGEGQVKDQHLVFSHGGDTDEELRTFAWSAKNGGLFAIERSLARVPMQPGETRTIEAFMPLLDRLVRFQLKADDYQDTVVAGEEKNLLRIESTDQLATGWKIPTIFWVDQQGIIQESQEAFLDRTTVRTSEQVATARNDLVRLDLGIDTGVPLSESFENAHDSTYAAYRVTLEGLNPGSVFATGLSQRVMTDEDGSVLLMINKVLPGLPQEFDARLVSKPTRDDMAPNRLIQSDDARVVAIANAVAGTVEDPWRAAVALEQYLYRRINKLDFSQVFSSAAEVAATGKGDCSEHAVLLAATCRARGIPARVAVGLLYSPQDRRFLYHMWNEVWIRDRWIPLDATMGRGGIGAAHLKLHDSSLAGESAYSMVAPVIYLIGKLKIELIDSRP